MVEIRESRAIGQDADNIWFLKAEDDTREDQRFPRETIKTEIQIAKGRNSGVGVVNVIFIPAFTRFENPLNE